MSDLSPDTGRTAGDPVLDLGAVLAAMQDQLDDLAATVEAQQRTIDELVRAQRAAGRGVARTDPGAP
jgi:hypothetical protein